jgi:hypothetical protein
MDATANVHDKGLEYGVLGPDIAADNMAHHIGNMPTTPATESTAIIKSTSETILTTLLDINHDVNTCRLCQSEFGAKKEDGTRVTVWIACRPSTGGELQGKAP